MNRIPLPYYGRNRVRVLKAVFAKRYRLDLSLMGNQWRVLFPDSSMIRETGCVLHLSVNTFDFRIRLDKQLLNYPDDKLAGVAWSKLPEELLPAVAEAALLGAIERFEQATGYYCSITDLELGRHIGPQETDITVPFLLRDPKGVSLAGEVDVPGNGVGFLVGMLGALPAGETRDLSSLPVMLSFRIGCDLFSLAEVRKMGAGDVYFIDNGQKINEFPVEIVASERLLFSGVFDKMSNRVTVQGREQKMGNESQFETTEEPEQSGDLDDIEVPLVFEVGRTGVALAKLKEMQPGYVFELSSRTTHPVSVQSGGKIIGYGELVDIDGRTGVRILTVGKDANS
jgi:type III secretion protein Q